MKQKGIFDVFFFKSAFQAELGHLIAGLGLGVNHGSTSPRGFGSFKKGGKEGVNNDTLEN